MTLGNMEGFTTADGEEKIPYKVTGAAVASILASIENVYEYVGSHGFSSIVEETASKIKEATEEQIHTKSFYKDTLYFDETIWNLDRVETNGYPELR